MTTHKFRTGQRVRIRRGAGFPLGGVTGIVLKHVNEILAHVGIDVKVYQGSWYLMEVMGNDAAAVFDVVEGSYMSSGDEKCCRFLMRESVLELCLGMCDIEYISLDCLDP